MMNAKQIFYTGLISAVTFASCKKSLDLLPSDVVPEEKAFLNVPSLERGLIGAYGTFNGAYDNDIYATALYSDEATLPTENNTGRGVMAYRWQSDPGTDEITGAWFDYYFGIDRVNRILAAADKITTANEAEQQTANRIKGEALALRAFGHLQLLINYSNGYELDALSVPYMTVSEIGKPSRLTVAEILAKIKADLAEAQTLIPANFNTRTRITLSAVYAMQARASLYGKAWDDAINAATAAINAVPLASRSEFPQIWRDQTMAGVIWKQKREAGQVRMGDAFWDRTQQRIMYGPSQELREAFDATNDIRYATAVLDRGSNRYSLGKYFGGDPGQEGLTDIKVFRTAEMYLIRAEARAEKGELALATKDLNDLRSARIANYTNEQFNSKQGLIDAIIKERFIELAFEGHRMGDLRRKGLSVTRSAADASNAQGAILLAPADNRYYYPIPVEEILANENMIQNPGYR